MSEPGEVVSDVVVLGAGMAGLAATVLLAREGLRVVCIEPEPFPRERVGESLDWSAPSLFEELGLDHDELVAAGLGTYKRHIEAVTSEGKRLIGRPRRWLSWWPMRFQQVTLHLDRRRFDDYLFREASGAGATFVWDAVVDVEATGDRITGCRTKKGKQFSASWYLDATGRRSLMARALGIRSKEWEHRRIAMWQQRDALMLSEGTTLYLDTESDELSWAWKIPIAPDRQSVGVVMSLGEFQELRRHGRPLDEVFATALGRFPRLRRVGRDHRYPVRTRTYRPHVTNRVAGDNWIMAGEAAAFVDPLTSTGAATAIRHGTEAARLIVAHRRSPERTKRRLRAYDRRVRRVAGLYNQAIEELIYRPRLRRAVGVRWASRAYVPLGYFTSSLYTRIEPTTPLRNVAFGFVLAFFRGWVRSSVAVGRMGRPRSSQPVA